PPVTPQFSTLSLHDALPICVFLTERDLITICITALIACHRSARSPHLGLELFAKPGLIAETSMAAPNEINLRSALNAISDVIQKDRKSTRLNSSHRTISYAV